jgi:hypothetical protein
MGASVVDEAGDQRINVLDESRGSDAILAV